LDAPDDLARMMAALHPSKSLEEVQLETGIPLDYLYRLSAHLVAWGIYTLNISERKTISYNTTHR